jgi:hypothetical protein
MPPFVVAGVVEWSELFDWLVARLSFVGLRFDPTRFLKRWFMDDINSSKGARK